MRRVFICVLEILALLSNVKSTETEKLKDMEVLSLQKKLVQNLEQFIEHSKTKLYTINEALHDLATFHIEAENEERLYASSAVSSFSLIRHMQSDWTHWQIYLQEEPGEDELEFLKKSKRLLPSKKDLNKASEEVFKMKNFSSLASPRDCIHLANLKINSKDFSTAEQLLRKALALLENPTYQEKIGVNVADIYTRLAHVLLVQEKLLDAKKAIEEGLKKIPYQAELLKLEDKISTQLLLT